MVNKEFSKENVFRLIDLFMRILNEQFETEKQKAEESKSESFEQAIYVTSAFKSVGGFQSLQTLRDYIKALKEPESKQATTTRTHHVKVCNARFFHEIACLKNEDQFGFFKSEADRRPSSCIWLDKDKAERLYDLFEECHKGCDLE